MPPPPNASATGIPSSTRRTALIWSRMPQCRGGEELAGYPQVKGAVGHSTDHDSDSISEATCTIATCVHKPLTRSAHALGCRVGCGPTQAARRRLGNANNEGPQWPGWPPGPTRGWAYGQPDRRIRSARARAKSECADDAHAAIPGKCCPMSHQDAVENTTRRLPYTFAQKY